MNRILNLIGVIILLQLWSSCGNQIPLTGGPKDETPPVLDSTSSTINAQIKFEKQDIELYFDEFVSLKDAAKQILISPPLEKPPIINSRLKKVSVAFNEEETLKENATYVINFGSAIQDFTEGNKLENYTFVFSTGDYIDSLSIKGNVQDAFTSEPISEMIVMLYIDHRDSIPFLTRPFYFAQTDKEGHFSINNLRADTFKVVVIEDLNLNYTYDPASERIGFLDSLFILTDSTTEEITLQLFKEKGPGKYAGYEAANQGKLLLDWENEVDTTAIRIIDSLTYYFQPQVGSSLRSTLWYRPRRKSRISWEHIKNGSLDTTTARINIKNTDTLPGSIKIIGQGHDKKIGLHPDDTLQLKLDLPIQKLDPDYILAIVNNTENDSLPGDTINIEYEQFSNIRMEVNATYNWTPGNSIDLTLYPGALLDFWDRSNDTINYKLDIAEREEFGNIKLKFSEFDTTTYFIKLMDKDKEVKEFAITGPDASFNFSKMPPSTYSLLIIEDRNGNLQWDPGNYLEGRQSELIYRTNLDALRPDWTLEQSISLPQIILESPSEDVETITTPPGSRR